MKVLIADDSPTTRFALRNNLEEWGYEVIEAVDGEEAWKVLDTDSPPRIAVLDWMMPGIEGVEICRRLQERVGGQFVYTILLTSKSEKQDLVYALENGAHNFQSKPISPAELRSHVNVGVRLVETEDNLVRMERIAAVGTLVGGIAHQFNNLNNGILGFVELLERDPAIGEKQKRWLDTMKRNVNKATGIINKLRSFAHNGGAMMRQVNLVKVVRDILQLLGEPFEADGIWLKTNLVPVPSTLMNENEIQQIISNLVINARHAVLERPEKVITLETGTGENEIYLKVIDTGCGILQGDLGKIFTPFFTTKGEHAPADSPQSKVRGVGLGLSVSERLIQRHGGRITVESSPGVGSTFTVRLPIRD